MVEDQSGHRASSRGELHGVVASEPEAFGQVACKQREVGVDFDHGELCPELVESIDGPALKRRHKLWLAGSAGSRVAEEPVRS